MQPVPVSTDDRASALLEAVKRAFAEKGFDGASMQDLARAAGMSAGNFYRYFPSKDAIVAAMVQKDLAEVQEDFLQIQRSGSPEQSLITAFERRIDSMSTVDGPLWAEIDAAAVRKPEIAAALSKMEGAVMELMTTLFARISGRNPHEAQHLYSAQVCFLMMLYKGAALWVVSKGQHTPDETRCQLRNLILQTIRRTISDIAADRPRQVS
ncbi:MAG: TetR/AcrR family transcriptional regulator [Rhodobacteraceae bacterium]|nr:TetR/AcrR family transcriptional regulator [Paracoccaceae bacterium]